mmetsp:Transcript_45570/g.97730  ORF Transcript_45570/g.97730 Transcript_45570/m.97730 type:complete len:86 (-) Transcript_45570:48-305(-)
MHSLRVALGEARGRRDTKWEGRQEVGNESVSASRQTTESGKSKMDKHKHKHTLKDLRAAAWTLRCRPIATRRPRFQRATERKRAK